MTEREWLECVYPAPLFDFVRGRMSDRKKRLFACACVRASWEAVKAPRLRNAVEVAEMYADGLWNAEAMAKIRAQVGMLARSMSRAESAPAWRLAYEAAATADASADSAASCFACPSLVDAIEEGHFETVQITVETRAKRADILRHIVGSPFRPLAALTDLPTGIVGLAEALYAGETCAFALRDSLLEAGFVEFAEHFEQEEHRKGCAWLDCLLGRA